MMDTFAAHSMLRIPGLACLLVRDQLECHGNAAIVARRCKSMIYGGIFAANSRHFLQSLDGHAFALFQRRLRLFIAEMSTLISIRAEISTALVFHAVYKSRERCMTRESTSASWASRAVAHLDRDVVAEAARSSGVRPGCQ